MIDGLKTYNKWVRWSLGEERRVNYFRVKDLKHSQEDP